MSQKLFIRNREIVGIRIKPNDGLWISYQLRLIGITQTALAKRIGVSLKAVNLIIRGKAHSTRIETALYQTLGYSTFEAMIAASRGKVAV